MSLFSNQEKLYFVFCGKGEKFFLNSALQLNETQKLWMELRASQYQNVFFVSRLGTQYRVSVLDEQSQKAYNSGCLGTFGFGTRWTPMVGEACEVTLDAKALWNWLTETLVRANAGASAVAMPFECLDELFKANPGNLSRLIDRPKNQSSLIVRLPMRIGAELHERFTDQNGVFGHRSPKGAMLCRPLAEILGSEEPLPVYETLKQRVGEQFVELDAVTFAGLKSMLRAVRLYRGELWTEEELNLYTRALFNWWYLPEVEAAAALPGKFVQRWAELFYPQRRGDGIYAALYKELCSDEWNTFMDRFMMVQKKVDQNTQSAFMKTLDRVTVERSCHVKIDYPQLSHVAELFWPGDYYDKITRAKPKLALTDKTRWDQMRRALLSPTCGGAKPERLKKIEAFYSCYRRAEQENDLDTFCRAVNALCFAGTYLYAESGETFDFDKRFDDYESCLIISHDYFELSKTRVGGSRVLEQSVDKVMEIRKEHYRKLLEGYDAQLKFSPAMMAEMPEAELDGVKRMLRQLQEDRQETQPKEKPVYADREMSEEEADAVLLDYLQN